MEQQPKQDILEILLTTDEKQNGLSAQDQGMNTLIVGVLSEVDASGQCKVAFDMSSITSPLAARTIVPLEKTDIGRNVCIMFELGNRNHPIIMGFLQVPSNIVSKIVDGGQTHAKDAVEVKVDGERVLIEGKTEIVLSCGKASITLTRDGKVLLRGTYLSSRSSGANLIKGGSVQLN